MTTEPTHSPERDDPDRDRIEAFLRGETAAFDDLVRRHESRVLRLCTRILGDVDAALDAAQEAFVKAWRALARFHGDARFSTWLTRIAINQCRNELRRRKTVKHASPLSLDVSPAGSDDGGESRGDGLASRGPDPFEVARGHEVAVAVQKALGQIDDEAREVLVLRDAEDLSYEEIAEILDVPVGTVRSRLHRARGEVRRRIGPTLSDSAVPPATASRPLPAARDGTGARSALDGAAWAEGSRASPSLPKKPLRDVMPDTLPDAAR